MTTQVKFLYNEYNDDLFAYFPFEEFSDGYMTAYSQLGQHSGCYDGYAKESREATKEEAQSLKIELLQIGYKLHILNKWEEKEPTEFEEQVNELYWSLK